MFRINLCLHNGLAAHRLTSSGLLPTLPTALAAARQEHAQQQAREARTAELAAAFTAAGLDVQNWRYRLGGMAAFLSRGEGSAEALVGQAQAAAQAAAHVPALHGYVV